MESHVKTPSFKWNLVPVLDYGFYMDGFLAGLGAPRMWGSASA